MMQPKVIQAVLMTNEEIKLTFPACLISERLAFVIFDEHLEIHEVKPTDDPNEYEIVKATNAIFYVGSDSATVLDNVTNLSLIHFARKYIPSDFYDSAKGGSVS